MHDVALAQLQLARPTRLVGLGAHERAIRYGRVESRARHRGRRCGGREEGWLCVCAHHLVVVMMMVMLVLGHRARHDNRRRCRRRWRRGRATATATHAALHIDRVNGTTASTGRCDRVERGRFDAAAGGGGVHCVRCGGCGRLARVIIISPLVKTTSIISTHKITSHNNSSTKRRILNIH